MIRSIFSDVRQLALGSSTVIGLGHWLGNWNIRPAAHASWSNSTDHQWLIALFVPVPFCVRSNSRVIGRDRHAARETVDPLFSPLVNFYSSDIFLWNFLWDFLWSAVKVLWGCRMQCFLILWMFPIFFFSEHTETSDQLRNWATLLLFRYLSTLGRFITWIWCHKATFFNIHSLIRIFGSTSKMTARWTEGSKISLENSLPVGPPEYCWSFLGHSWSSGLVWEHFLGLYSTENCVSRFSVQSRINFSGKNPLTTDASRQLSASLPSWRSDFYEVLGVQWLFFGAGWRFQFQWLLWTRFGMKFESQ